MVEPVGGEERGEGLPPQGGRGRAGKDQPSREHLTNEHPDGAIAGLAGGAHAHPAGAQGVGETGGLRGGPGAVDAFEDDERGVAHGSAGVSHRSRRGGEFFARGGAW